MDRPINENEKEEFISRMGMIHEYWKLVNIAARVIYQISL